MIIPAGIAGYDITRLIVPLMYYLNLLNISLLPYVMEEELLNIGDKLFEYAPKLGEDFTRIGQMGMNTALRDRVKDMKDFSFSFRGDDIFIPERVKVIETVVRRQAEAILSNDKLYTKDVFFSPKAQALEEQKAQVKAASDLMNQFADRLEKMDLGSETFISVCDTTNDVLCIIENNSCSIIVGFLNEEIRIEHNVMPISLKELKENNHNFYNTFEDIYSELKLYLREAGRDKFSAKCKDCEEITNDTNSGNDGIVILFILFCGWKENKV